jgi:hypothetical protein
MADFADVPGSSPHDASKSTPEQHQQQTKEKAPMVHNPTADDVYDLDVNRWLDDGGRVLPDDD